MQPDMFVYHAISSLPSPGGLALDCGCGRGRHLTFLAEQGYRALGLDVSAMVLREARGQGKAQGWEIDLGQGSMAKLPLRDATVDLLLCTHVLESLDSGSILRAVAEFHRVLRPGGHLLAVTAAREGADVTAGEEVEPNTFVFGPPGPGVRLHFLSREELRAWFRSFRTIEILHLQLEEPPTAPVRAHWALWARRT